MKSLIITLFLIVSSKSLALADNEISEMFIAGKLEEIEIKDVLKTKKITLKEWNSILPSIQAVALEKENIWPDTILEGEVYQLEDAKLDLESINALIFKNKIVGFSAFVIAKGASTHACYYNDDDNEYLNCLKKYPGEISEKFIVNRKGEEIAEYFEDGPQFE